VAIRKLSRALLLAILLASARYIVASLQHLKRTTPVAQNQQKFQENIEHSVASQRALGMSRPQATDTGRAPLFRVGGGRLWSRLDVLPHYALKQSP